MVLLDDQEALAEYQAKVAGNEAAASAVLAAKATVKLLENLRDNTRLLYNNGKGTSEYEVHKAELDVVRAKAESEEKWALQIKAGSEMDKARVQLEMHHIRAPISGMLQPTNRKPGEGIRAQETLFQIQNTDLLQAEGTIPTGYRYQVKRNMEVIIEPSVEMAPRKRFVASAGRINGIAFSNHADPQIVVACEDKTAKVYSLAEVQLHVFAHDVAVRSVACTPAGVAAHLCLTGAEDGIGRLWDLDAKAVKGRDLEGHKHKGVITAVAFSPDAKTCATADSRDICLWDVATGKLKYVFPPQHLGEIQSLTFTPQAKLVSAARDNTLAVWSLGETGANLDYAVQGRSGDVARVGISHSGRYALFDIAQSLRVITLAEQLLKRQDVAELRSMTDAYKFATFAIYSPDDRLILTGTNTESRLSVWKAPTATSRATELRQFTPNDRVTLTCAAISPSEKHPFAVSGTKEGVVHVWPMPTESEIRAPIKGRITFVDNNADATARNFRVWAEFDNTQAQLPPGAAVTLVITPVEPAAPAK